MYGVSAALVGMLLLAAVTPQHARADVPVDLELVLGVDVSGSVDPAEGKLQRAGYVSAFSHKAVISAVRSGFLRRIAVTYVEWADSHRQRTVLPWTLIEGEASALAFADKLEQAPIMRGRFTSISALIGYAMPLFENNGFEGTRRVIDISGDGANNSGELVTLARNTAVAAGVIINGLPIVNDRPQQFGPQVPDLDLYYEHCVIGGPGSFFVVAKDFESFAVAVRKKMILEIAGRMPSLRLLRRTSSGRWTTRNQRKAPECDIGERQLDQRLRNMMFLDN